MAGADEFETIARLLRPLSEGAPGALNLEDDAAVIASRPGFDLVATKDAIVEGVHFMAGDPLETVARKLLRVNLSDLAAKGAAPFGYLLACAWTKGSGWAEREAFARGLAADQAEYGLALLGGDTVSTDGPMVFSATLLGWVEAGGMVRRSGARAGDIVQVSGPIGDGWLGLLAARGEIDDPALVERYRLPRPRVGLPLAGASAAADVSDGLIADAGHIAGASGVGMEIDLERIPLSAAGRAHAAGGAERLVELVTGGDDYEIVAAAPAPLPGFTAVGRVVEGEGVAARLHGEAVTIRKAGWRHGRD